MAIEDEYIGGAPPPLDGRGDIIGGAGPVGSVPPPAPRAAAGTEAERLAATTRAGAFAAVPDAYAEGDDWQTIKASDPFRLLYLDYRQYARISDEQVHTNARVLGEFWESRRKLLIRGGEQLKRRFGEGTIEGAPARLQKAAAALGSAAGREAYFNKLEGERLQQATSRTHAYLLSVLELTGSVLRPNAIQIALGEAAKHGFTPVEAETYLLAAMRQASLAPVRTAQANPNQLLETWTLHGQPLTGQPHTKVLGHDVYSLAEAAQVLYDALARPADRDRALRNLGSADYLSGIAQDLRERDTQQDVAELFERRTLTPAQRQLAALYLLGPGLPFYLDGGRPAFASPAELLARTARSAPDFAAAEAAFAAGLLPVWLQAAAPAPVKAALAAASGSRSASLGFRQFLHAAKADFPLWIGDAALATPTELAAYIRRDERSWEMVYGSLTSGNLGPWLAARGQTALLAEQDRLAEALLTGVEPASAAGRRLVVQALLEALEPQAPTPALHFAPARLSLTGLSGEAVAERVLTLTNTTGGPVRVQLALEPALAGVSFSATELFFDQRAPGQQQQVTVRGNPTLMPHDGQHAAQLRVRTAYSNSSVPVVAEAVFPTRQFLLFVGGAALGLGAALGAVRLLLGYLLGETTYRHMLAGGGLLPLDRFDEAGRGAGPLFLVALLLLLGVGYLFYHVLKGLAKPRRPA